MGEVVGLPRKIQNEKIGYKGFSAKDIQVGDTAIFSYNIIHDFKITEQGADPVYRNRFFFEGNEYFVADITKVFGVIRDGEITMVNGFVMLGDFKESILILPQTMKKMKRASETYVQHIGFPKTHENKIDIKSDDNIYFIGSSSQKYQINDKKFTILQQNKILGKKIED
jgi:co-chaperonin GroES (HSP10)